MCPSAVLSYPHPSVLCTCDNRARNAHTIQTADAACSRRVRRAQSFSSHSLLFTSRLFNSCQSAWQSLALAQMLCVEFAMHDEKLEKLPMAHNIYTITSPMLIPLSESQERGNLILREAALSQGLPICVSIRSGGSWF